MFKIQDKNPIFNQYWFYVDTPEYNLYPNSDCSTFNLGTPVKMMTKRIVGISTPKIINTHKEYKYIINTDFNIDGAPSDWMCSKGYLTAGVMGGIIDDDDYDCSKDPDYLLKNFTDLFKSLIEKEYIIVHLSMIAEDTYLNQPCDSTNICKKCWFQDNPDQQYLQSLFNVIYKNNFPSPINNLKLEYNNLTLFGYSVGAGAVSRYINEFPLLKTVPNNFVFPKIKTSVMIAGGSLYCYSKDCGNDPNCGGDPHFKNCPYPNINVRGCCPHDLSEPNYDNGKFSWENHPSVLLVQSIDDSYADPMASKYYYDILLKHGVNTKRITADSTIHGLANEYQVSKIIEWINNETSNNNETSSNNSLKYISILLFVISLVLLIKNIFKYNYTTILVSLILISISILLMLFYKNNSPIGDNGNSSIDNYLEDSLKNMSEYPQVTAGELFDKVVEIQNDIYGKNPDIGGILVHLMELEQMEQIVNNKKFSLKFNSGGIGAFTDCSIPGQNKQNCSAWTYLRKDLPPIVYSYPSSQAGPDGNNFWRPTVGIIVDPSRMWPLITTMGIIDSATDGRNCGSQDPSYQFNIFDVNNSQGRCNPIVYNKEGNKLDNQSDYCIFQSLNTEVGCNTNCNYSDDIINTNCRMQNSGGSINNNSWIMSETPGYYWDCPDKKYRYNTTDSNFKNGLPNCYKATEINWEDINENDQKQLNKNKYGNNGSCKKWAKYIPSPDCYLTSPNLYQPQDLTQSGQTGTIINGTNLEIVNNGTSKDPINNDRNYVYIGKDINTNVTGATMSEQTWQNCTFNSAEPTNCKIKLTDNIPISTYNTITRQAKFKKENWSRWITELKKLWSYVFNTLSKDQGFINTKSYLDNDTTVGNDYNWVYGNPCNTGDWWENEVNVFVNDNMAKYENSSLNKLLRSSTIGFFYIGNTCEDFTKELPTRTYVNKNCSFDNSEQRCSGYLCSIDNLNKTDINSTICDNKINGKKVTYKELKEIELDRITRGKNVVKKMVDKFNKKYRNNTTYKIKSYKFNIANNAFPEYNSISNVVNNIQNSKTLMEEY